METSKKAKVLVLGLVGNKFERVTSFEDVNNILVNEHQTILYNKTYIGDTEIIGIIPNTFIIRISWE